MSARTLAVRGSVLAVWMAAACVHAAEPAPVREARPEPASAPAPSTPVASAPAVTVQPESPHPVPAEGPPPERVAQGAALYAKQICSVCHSNDGTARAAPTFKGLFGTEQKLRDGSVVIVDAAYIRESVLNPGAKVAEGFQPVMPSYVGRLSDADIEALTAYLQSLR